MKMHFVFTRMIHLFLPPFLSQGYQRMAVDNTNRLLSVGKLVLILDIDQTILQACDNPLCARLPPSFMKSRNIHTFLAQGKMLYIRLR